MKGTVAYTAGSSNDSGAIQMEAANAFDANVQMHLSSGERTDIANQDAGTWSLKGVTHTVALQNAMTIAAWFSPAHIVQTWLTDPTFLVTSAGTEQPDGTSLQHVHCVRGFAPNNGTTQLLQQATAMDLLLDTATSLPAELDFNAHPDDDEAANIPVRIVFSDYRSVTGGSAPFHVQKYFNGTLLLDITVQDVTTSTSIPAADFLLQ